MASTSIGNQTPPKPGGRSDGPAPSWTDRPGRIAVPALAFALVVYLSFRGGGYDFVVYASVGVLAWWVVLLGVLIGTFSLDRLAPPARLGLLLVAAFAAWTGLSMLWSESAGRTAQELARVTTYAGAFALAAAAQRRGELRLTLGAIAAAIGLVAGVSLLSRMEPDWFPKNETIDLLFAAQSRLNYPLNYWNGLAALLAVGTPLIVHYTARARTALGRGLASATLPAIGLAMYLTLSRGGWLALLVALTAMVRLYPRLLALASPVAIFAVGTAVLVFAAESREAFMEGLRVGEGLAEGDQLLVILLAVCASAGLAPLGIRRAINAGMVKPLRLPTASRRRRSAVVAIVVVALVAVAVAADLPGRIDSGWEQFKEAPVERGSDRFDSASGNGRYSWWASAFRAFESGPVLGIGSGTYEFWWSRDGELPGRVVNAHSLFAETLGELGAVGFLLVVMANGGLVVICGRLTLLARGEGDRRLLAASTGACSAFVAASAVDWAWEMPVVPISFMIVAGATLGSVERRPSVGGSGRLWAPLAAIAVAGLIAVGMPLLAVNAIRNSQAQFRDGDLDAALADAKRARQLAPYSGEAALQEALILESIQRLGPSLRAARDAVDKEPTNWQTWLILARIESVNAHSRRAVSAFDRAGELHPSSPLP